MVQKPKQTQRLPVTGRARRSKTLQTHKPGGDPRDMRDASAAARGDDYEFPIEVDQTSTGRRKVRLKTTLPIDPELGLTLDPEEVVTSISYATINATSSLQRKGIEVGHLMLPLYVGLSSGSSPSWLTTGAGVKEPPKNNERYRYMIDLRRYDEVRFHLWVEVVGGAVDQTFELGYSTTASGSLGSIDGSSTTLDLTSLGEKDTDWMDLVSGAQIADAYIGIIQNSTGGFTPTFNVRRVTAEFRAKST